MAFEKPIFGRAKGYNIRSYVVLRAAYCVLEVVALNLKSNFSNVVRKELLGMPHIESAIVNYRMGPIKPPAAAGHTKQTDFVPLAVRSED